eukprot:2472498-Rhodomonas_salina.2
MGNRVSNPNIYTPPIHAQRTSNAGVVMPDQLRPIYSADVNLIFSRNEKWSPEDQELLGLQGGCNWLRERNAEMERRLQELERQRCIAYAPVYVPLDGPFDGAGNLSMLGPLAGPLTKEEDEKNDTWVELNDNAYGAFIHQAFHHSVFKSDGAIREYGSMITLSFLTQICFAFELWLELPKTRQPSLCSTSPFLQASTLSLFAVCVCLRLHLSPRPEPFFFATHTRRKTGTG